jgi:hypothetical protein
VTGGYNVYPREVEDVLAKHPQVREVAVVGLPSDEWWESVAAFIVPRDCSLDEDSLLVQAADHLAPYKRPAHDPDGRGAPVQRARQGPEARARARGGDFGGRRSSRLCARASRPPR